MTSNYYDMVENLYTNIFTISALVYRNFLLAIWKA
jgi:hypothetical protein